MIQLQYYKFTIVYHPGIKNGNADALSRMPCEWEGLEVNAEDENAD